MAKKETVLAGWKNFVACTLLVIVCLAFIVGFVWCTGKWIEGAAKLVNEGIVQPASKTRVVKTIGRKVSYWLEDPNDLSNE